MVLTMTAMGCAHAQSELMLMQGASPSERALACLVQPNSSGALLLSAEDPDERVLIRIRLNFESADEAPRGELLYSNGDRASIERVLSHVSGYRLPCWQPTLGSLEAIQEFSPNGTSGLLVTAGSSARDSVHSLPGQDGCTLQSLPLWTGDDDAPDLQHSVNLIDHVRFPEQALEAPTMEVKGLTASARLRRQLAERIAARYRTGCRLLAGKSVEQSVRFLVSGTARLALANRNLRLSNWLTSLRAKGDGPAFFDLDSMACPFAVKFALRQPLSLNRVKEVGPSNPNRALFLHWLSKLASSLGVGFVEHFLLQEVLLDVPCGQLDMPA